jgi:hypothetical protein
VTEQCCNAGVACFGKQLGSVRGPHKGGDAGTWPAELRIWEYSTVVTNA